MASKQSDKVTSAKAGAMTKSFNKVSLKDADDDEENEDEDDEADDEFKHVPINVMNRIKTIRNLHNSIEAIDAEYKAERIVLERKYIDKKALINIDRTKIISGEVEPPTIVEEESADTAVVSAPETTDQDSDIKGIPGFWLTVLTSHPSVGELITEEDVTLLESLADITCSYADDFTSFTLSFAFNNNEYFSNTVLTKKYEVTPDLLDDKAPALSKCEGCEIQWKEGKNLTMTEVKKKQKAKSGKNKGQVRMVTTMEPKASFFWFFGQPLTEEEEMELQEKEEEPESVKLTMEDDYEVGHSIRTSVVPEAVLWYTGEAMEDDDEEDDDDDEDDDEDEDEDEDDDDDEEDDVPPAKGKRGTKGVPSKNKLAFTPEGGFSAQSADGGPQGDKAPECKQN